MGEIADAMINGEMCEWCGVFLEDPAPGYPRRCAGCEPGGAAEHPIYDEVAQLEDELESDDG